VHQDSLEKLDFPLHLEKVKLRAAIRSVLRPYNLTSVIADNTLVITSPEVAPRRQLQQTISLDLNEVSLKAALRHLTRATAVNIVLDARVPSENLSAVTLNVEDVSLETAARLVAELAGLKAVPVGNVIFITTETRATKIRAELVGAAPPERLVPLPVARPLLPPVHTPHSDKKKPPEP
jgi:hypothetical protein